ncbi:hypothetical protein Tco_0515176 [Tanacetum coccineum]
MLTPTLVVRSGAQDEGQAGPDPGKLDEGQAGPNLDDVAESQPLPTPSVLAGPNLEHSDVEITDPSSQPQPEHMDEGFTATAYPDVQENLKLTVDEQVIPEEPVSSTGTLSSLQHLAKDFSFGDQFLNDKPSEADNEKTTADTEAESMVSVTIQQDTSIIPPMTSPVIDLVSRPDSPNVHWPLPTTTTTTAAPTTTTTLPLPPQPQQGSSDSILIKRMGELEQHIANLAEENQALETRLDKQRNRIHKVETMDWPKMIREQMDSIRRDEVEDFDVDKAQEETKKKSNQDSPNTPPGSPPSPPPPPLPPSGASGASSTTGASDSAQAPPPPPPSLSTHQGDQSTSTAAPSSSKTVASVEYSAWITTDTRVKPSITTIPDDLYMDDETTADEQAYSSGDGVGHDHIPIVNLRQSWWKPLTEDRPATPEPAWTILSSDMSMPTHNWASALKSTYVPLHENSLLAQTGDMATFMDWYCKQQGISELTPKKSPAFEIAKVVFIMTLFITNAKCEECHKLLTDQVDDAILRYNVSKPLPLGGEPGHVSIQPTSTSTKTWSLYVNGRRLAIPGRVNLEDEGAYNPDVYWSNWCLIRIRDCQRNASMNIAAMSGISPLCFKNNGFYIDRFISGRRPPSLIDSPRAVTFTDRYGVQMIMRFNEIHKFSDGTLQQIDEALDYRVKEFQINRTNPGMNNRFWTKKDVDRSKDFIFAIQKRLKTRRIFRNLESFVGGRIREGNYRYLFPRSPPEPRRIYPGDYPLVSVEVLRSVLTDPEDQEKMEMETPRSSGVNSPPNAHT